MLGVKVIKFTTREKMSLEELYARIKDLPFEAGRPEFVKHGRTPVIAFPPEDRENQVWLIKTKKGFQIQRSVIIAGIGNAIKNSVQANIVNDLTFGTTGMISMFGKPKKRCMAHCDDAAAKINSLGL